MNPGAAIKEEYTVVIVGGGVSGLSAACRLGQLGIRDVAVLERETEAGGAPRYIRNRSFGWREFKRPMMGPEFSRRLRTTAAASAGILTGAQVIKLEAGGVLTVALPTGPVRIKARRVILATGAREAHRHNRLVTGARPFGVMAHGPLLRYIHFARRIPFKKPLVIGSGLIALACLDSLHQAGLSPAALIGEHQRCSEPYWLIKSAGRFFRVPFYKDTRLQRILGRERVEGAVLERGGQRIEVPCDGVVFTGDFIPEAHLVQRSHLAFHPGSFGPETDQFQRLSDPHYFACGNVLRPYRGSWGCSLEGERAAVLAGKSLADGLPGWENSVPIKTSPPIRFVWPQRLYPPASGHPLPGYISVLFDEPVSGKLGLRVDGQVRIERRVSSRPEKLIRLRVRGRIGSFGSLSLDFEAAGRPAP